MIESVLCQGEIYLSRCLTAVGPQYGFLGKFYQIIKAHSPGCIFRGNLGNSKTFPDGTQGVWSSEVSKEDYDKQIKAFGEMAATVYKQIDGIGDKLKNGNLTVSELQKKVKLPTK